MLHKLVDNVYAINLPGSTDRRANIDKQCFDIGTHYQLWPAIDGRAENVEWHESDYAKNVHGWTQGAAGLVYTTINIIKDAKEKGYKSILILEDDIVFRPRIYETAVDAMKHLPEDWELFHLAAQHFKTPGRKGNLLQLEGAWSCQAYMVHERAYDMYLEWLELVDRPIDSITAEKFHPRGKSFSTIIKQIVTLPNDSTIRGKFMNYNV